MIGWEKWRSLLVVSQYGSYSKAAITLGIDATTVGRRLKQLETELGFELHFRRDGKLTPTRRCEDLLRHLESADDALRNASQLSVPTDAGATWRELRMTAPPFLLKNIFAPAIGDLTARRNIRVEMIATSSNAALTRREADISVRIEDRPKDFKIDYERIRAVKLGTLDYAVFAAKGTSPQTQSWAGIFMNHQGTTGTNVMAALAGANGIRYQAQHFDTVGEFVAAGVAKALLPIPVAEMDSRLERVSGTKLEQPLWMLYHQQDEDVPHLRAGRTWISDVVGSVVGARE